MISCFIISNIMNRAYQYKLSKLLLNLFQLKIAGFEILNALTLDQVLAAFGDEDHQKNSGEWDLL